MSKAACLAPALLLVTTGACSSPRHKALDPGLARIQDCAARSAIPQDHIVVYFEESKLSNPGLATDLVGALLMLGARKIDDNLNRDRRARAETAATALIAETRDFDFRREFWSALQSGFARSPWLKVRSFESAVKAETPSGVDLGNRSYLTLHTSYRLSIDHRTLVLSTHAKLFVPGNREPAYFGDFTYYSGPASAPEGSAIVATWVKDRAAAYREALKDGIRATVQMLEIDVLGPRSPGDAPRGEEVGFSQDDVDGGTIAVRGPVLATQGNRVIVRLRDGNLVSVTRKR